MTERETVRSRLRLALAALYGLVGAVHLASPDTLMPIMPAWVPEPRLVILATGACETAGALALLHPRLRRTAGIGLALYALCVWPANLKQAMEGIVVPPLPDSWWYHGPRLAFQPVLIWAGLFAGGALDCPWRRSPRGAGA